MTEKELNEIRDSIEFQMIIEQNNGYKNEYSPLLQEEISLYNEAMRIKKLLKMQRKFI